MSCAQDRVGVAVVNGGRREHRHARVTMLEVVGRKEAAEVRSRVFKRDEASRILPKMPERFERCFGEWIVVAHLRSAQRSNHSKRVQMIAEHLSQSGIGRAPVLQSTKSSRRHRSSNGSRPPWPAARSAARNTAANDCYEPWEGDVLKNILYDAYAKSAQVTKTIADSQMLMAA